MWVRLRGRLDFGSSSYDFTVAVVAVTVTDWQNTDGNGVAADLKNLINGCQQVPRMTRTEKEGSSNEKQTLGQKYNLASHMPSGFHRTRCSAKTALAH